MLPSNKEDKLHFAEIALLWTIIRHPMYWLHLVAISWVRWCKCEELLGGNTIAWCWQIRHVSTIKASWLLHNIVCRWVVMMLLLFGVIYLFHWYCWVFVSWFLTWVDKIGGVIRSDLALIKFKIIVFSDVSTSNDYAIIHPTIISRVILLSSFTISWVVSSYVIRRNCTAY